MSLKTEQAAHLFSKAYNCSQSTLAVFAEELGLSFEQATQIASGFGAGMCYQGKTCGAVSGAYMAIGLISGKKFTNAEMVKEHSYQLMKQFNKNFVVENNSLECREILGIDISTSEGIELAQERELFTKKCPLLVSSAVSIIEDLLKK